MKRNILKVGAALMGLLLLLCILCQPLARPEHAGASGDRFVGLYVIYEEEKGGGQVLDGPGWVEYGEDVLYAPGIGKVSLPNKVLFGVYDPERDRYDFPGLEGFCCCVRFFQGLDDESHVDWVSDLADSHLSVGVDTGKDFEVTKNSYTLTGTAFYGPPLDGRKWKVEDSDFTFTPYPVYQAPEGEVYMGAEPAGFFRGSSGFHIMQTESSQSSLGDSVERGVRIEVQLEEAARVTSVEVKAFDENDREISTKTLAMDEIGDGMSLELEENAVWALVIETDWKGQVKRTAHSLDNADQGAGHRLVRLDDDGLGHAVYLELRR